MNNVLVDFAVSTEDMAEKTCLNLYSYYKNDFEVFIILCKENAVGKTRTFRAIALLRWARKEIEAYKESEQAF